eukprot:6557618-Prymnesium_polylepis.1
MDLSSEHVKAGGWVLHGACDREIVCSFHAAVHQLSRATLNKRGTALWGTGAIQRAAFLNDEMAP